MESASPQILKRSISNFEDQLQPLQIKKIKVMTPEVVGALNRSGLTPGKAVPIIAAVAKALGHDLNDISVSKSTVKRTKKIVGQKIAKELKNSLRIADVLVLHWDGKLLPSSRDSGKSEILPVVITGGGDEQLLGAPELKSGTGLNCANAIIEKLTEWDLTGKIKALCFDTTSSNTGKSFLFSYTETPKIQLSEK